MGEKIPHGQSRTETADLFSEAGRVTTEVAARAVRVSLRTIRRYIDQGRLQAKQRGEGVGREWLVSVDGLHALLALPTVDEQRPRNAYTDTARERADVFREMSARLERRAGVAATRRVRVELTERSRSTLEKERRRSVRELEDERRWRAEAERENEEFRQELEALKAESKDLEAPESLTPPVLDSEGTTRSVRGGEHAATEAPFSEDMTSRRRGWWWGFFGIGQSSASGVEGAV
jgi:hypothetical protein